MVQCAIPDGSLDWYEGGGGGSNIAWIHVIRSPVLLLLRRGMTTECAAPRMDTCDWQPK